MSARYLIVNADDFGQSFGVNRGIVRAHENGILTSTSMMVCWPAAVEAGQYARSHPRLGVGLHLDFGEWTYRDGKWTRLYEMVEESDAEAVSKEVRRQWTTFERLTGRLPTHLDSHQHVHRNEPLRSIVVELAEQFDLPVRDITSSVKYCGRFYGQSNHGVSYPEYVSVSNAIEILATLTEGATEIGCHPAAADDLDTMYRAERLIELATLCDPRVRSAIEDMNIQLKSFANWRSYAMSPS